MLHYFDRASMAHSLEVRVPFLDHHLVEFAATVPGRLKVRRGRTTKFILKRAARGLVPDRIIDKPKIGFFNAAVDRWFASQAEGAIPDYLLASDARYAEFLELSEVRALIERHRATHNSRDGRLLLSILMLEIWLAAYLPRALGAPTIPA
jgi:asparagine synthase (glutamine-hydrolysing)